MVELDNTAEGGEWDHGGYDSLEEARAALSDKETEWLKQLIEVPEPPAPADTSQHPWDATSYYTPGEGALWVKAGPYKTIEVGPGYYDVAMVPPQAGRTVPLEELTTENRETARERAVEYNRNFRIALLDVAKSEERSLRQRLGVANAERQRLIDEGEIGMAEDEAKDIAKLTKQRELVAGDIVALGGEWEWAEASKAGKQLSTTSLPPSLGFEKKINNLLTKHSRDQYKDDDLTPFELSPDFYNDPKVKQVFDAWDNLTEWQDTVFLTGGTRFLPEVKAEKDLFKLADMMSGERVEFIMREGTQGDEEWFGKLVDQVTGGVLHVSYRQGEISLDSTRSRGTRDEIAVDEGMPAGSSGKLFYQLAFQHAHNNGYRVIPSGLLEINQYRRPFNVEASILANRDSRFTALYAQENVIDRKNWNTDSWQNDAVRILLTNARKVMDKVPALRGWSYDFEQGVFRKPDGSQAGTHQGGDFSQLLKDTFPSAWRNKYGIGNTTLMRTLITSSAFLHDGPLHVGDALTIGMGRQGIPSTTGLLASGKGVSLDHAAAVKEGDMEEAEFLVADIAHELGYKGPYWHGTKAPKFTKFRKGSSGLVYLSEQESESQKYADAPSAPKQFFIKSTKVFDYENNIDHWHKAHRLYNELGGDVDPDSGPEKNQAWMLFDDPQTWQGTEKEVGLMKVLLAEGYDEFIYQEESGAITHAVAKADQIKSAAAATYDDAGNLIPLSERFDLESSDLRFSGKGVKLTKAQQGASLLGDMYGGKKPAPPGSRSKEEAARLIQAKTMKAYGGKVIEEGPEDDRISEIITAEAIAHMEGPGPDATTWYDEDVNVGIAAVAAIHPEIIYNSDDQSMFLLGTAITSNGQTVNLNANYGLKQYRHFRDTGRFMEVGWGAEKGAMIKSFTQANILLQEIGPAKLREFLSKDFTVKGLTQVGYKINGEKMTEKVKGSMIFGPKIGQGFYQNLSGNFDPVTIDMWLMRTWGRLTGNLIGKPHLLEKGRKRLVDALTIEGKVADGVALETIEERRLARGMGYSVGRDNVPKPTNKRPAPEVRFNPEDVPPITDLEAFTKFARDIQNKYNKVYEKHAKDFQSEKKIKAESALAGSAIVSSQGSPKDVPANGSERQRIRRVMRKALAMLSEQGYDLNPAQLQAVLWFPEKRHFINLGVRVPDPDQSYRQAFSNLVYKEGITDAEINASRTSLSASRRAGREPADHDDAGGDESRGKKAGKTTLQLSAKGAASSLTGEGKFLTRVVEDSAINAAVKAGLDPEYEVLANRDVHNEALHTVFDIDDDGVYKYRESAIAEIQGADSQLHSAARVAAGIMVMRRFNTLIEVARQAGDLEQADTYATQAAQMAEWLGEYGRAAGRIVQMYSTYGMLHPYAMARGVKTLLGRVTTRKVRAKGLEEEVEELINSMRLAQDVSASGVTRDKGVLKFIERSLGLSRRKDESLWGRYSGQAAKRIMAAIRAGGRTPRKQAVLEKFTNQLVSEAKARIREAGVPVSTTPTPLEKAKDMDLLSDMLQNPAAYSDAFEKVAGELDALALTDPDLAQAVTDVFGQVTRDESNKVITGAVTQSLEEIGKDIPGLIRSHYKEKDATSEKLANRIISELSTRGVEMTADRARRLANRIDVAYKKLLADKTKSEINRITKQSGKRDMKRVAKTTLQKLVELTNLGAFQDEDVYNAVAEGLGLPSYNKAFVKKIERLVDLVQEAPEGSPKAGAELDLQNAIHDQVGTGLSDILFSIRFANMLSGYSTQQINFISTLENMTFGLAGQALRLRDPMAIGRMFASVFRGLKTGGKEAIKVLWTGRSRKGVAMTRFRHDSVLERWTMKGGRLNPINYLKYVSRVMAANDALFRFAASEGKAFVLAHNLAKERGMTGEQKWAAIKATLKLEEPSMQEAWAKAEAEGLEGRALARRADELIHMSRDPELQTVADEFGSLSAFQQEPRGWLGLMAKKVNEVANPRLRPGELPEEGVITGRNFAKFFVPFIYTLANVGNIAIDYTPGFGHIRTYLSAYRSKKGMIKELDSEKLKDQAYRAHTGSLAMMAIGAMLESEYDEEEPWLELTAQGPKTWDEQDRLRKAGQLHPYTLKVGNLRFNYLETPLAIPFAFLGHHYDARRYGNEADISLARRFTAGALVAMNSWTNLSFMASVDKAMQVMTVKDEKEAARLGKDVFSFGASSFVLPNLVRQLDTLFDPTKTKISDLNSMYQQSVPFARREGYPDLDMYGQDVQRSEGPLWRRFGHRIVRATGAEDPTITMMGRHGSYASQISKQSQVTRNDEKLPITPIERYAWQKVSGHEFQRRMNKDLVELQGMDAEQFDERLKDHWDDARAFGKEVLEAATDEDLEKIARLKLKPASGSKIPPPKVRSGKPQKVRRLPGTPYYKTVAPRKRTAMNWLKGE